MGLPCFNMGYLEGTPALNLDTHSGFSDSESTCQTGFDFGTVVEVVVVEDFVFADLREVLLELGSFLYFALGKIVYSTNDDLFFFFVQLYKQGWSFHR